ncbi:hypothetical protein Micbo1qcDRAFT_176659 [Microdochium bolleyi]|uniref:Uncharacterized protein n=1 Tax=Microdochium bolleyi TaxID=196109 RepID=A0A136IZC7_9PEZI|nr:hypothetical protein Micbo1qcDRAFT_176659 [Microdochium bolleyi]
MHAGMRSPAIAPWHVALSDRDFEKLRAGFELHEMEDRWYVVSIADDETRGSHTRSDGTRDPSERLAVHVIRSWVGREFYRLHIVRPVVSGEESAPPGAGARVRVGATAVAGNGAPSGGGRGGDDDGGGEDRSSAIPTSARIEAITWDTRSDEPQLEVSEQQAKLQVVLIARDVLGCELEAIPEIDVFDAWL